MIVFAGPKWAQLEKEYLQPGWNSDTKIWMSGGQGGSLLGCAGVGKCPGLSNRCTFWLANQQAGRYISATELDLDRFRPFPFGDILCHLSTQVNDSDLDY